MNVFDIKQLTAPVDFHSRKKYIM